MRIVNSEILRLSWGSWLQFSRSKAIEQEAKVDSHCRALACVIFQA